MSWMPKQGWTIGHPWWWWARYWHVFVPGGARLCTTQIHSSLTYRVDHRIHPHYLHPRHFSHKHREETTAQDRKPCERILSGFLIESKWTLFGSPQNDQRSFHWNLKGVFLMIGKGKVSDSWNCLSHRIVYSHLRLSDIISPAHTWTPIPCKTWTAFTCPQPHTNHVYICIPNGTFVSFVP